MPTTKNVYNPMSPGAAGYDRQEEFHVPPQDGLMGRLAANDHAGARNKFPIVRLNGCYPTLEQAAAQNGNNAGWQYASSAASGFTATTDANGQKITTSAGSGDYHTMRYMTPWVVATDKLVKCCAAIMPDTTSLSNLLFGIGTQFGDPTGLSTQQIVFTKAAGAAAPWIGHVRGTGADAATGNLTPSADNTFLDLCIEFVKCSVSANSWGRWGIAAHGSRDATWTNFTAAQITQLNTITGNYQFLVGCKTGSAVARSYWLAWLDCEADF